MHPSRDQFTLVWSPFFMHAECAVGVIEPRRCVMTLAPWQEDKAEARVPPAALFLLPTKFRSFDSCLDNAVQDQPLIFVSIMKEYRVVVMGDAGSLPSQVD
jgi:hypothetical protein